jgi:hypothetical protein
MWIPVSIQEVADVSERDLDCEISALVEQQLGELGNGLLPASLTPVSIGRRFFSARRVGIALLPHLHDLLDSVDIDHHGPTKPVLDLEESEVVHRLRLPHSPEMKTQIAATPIPTT